MQAVAEKAGAAKERAAEAGAEVEHRAAEAADAAQRRVAEVAESGGQGVQRGPRGREGGRQRDNFWARPCDVRWLAQFCSAPF